MLPTDAKPFIDRVAAACDFKNILSEQAITRAIEEHCDGLGVERVPLVRYNALDAFASAARAAWATRDATWAAWATRDAARATWAAWATRDAARAAARATWAAWDASYGACICPGAIVASDEKTFAVFEPILRALEAGLWFYFYGENSIGWIQQPVIRRENGRLHAADAPAFELHDDRIWFYKGVHVTEQIVLQPETLSCEQILTERNAEVRRVMIERFGLDRFLAGVKATPIDTDDKRSLYKIVVKEDEPIVAVKVQCPSTGQVYFLRVPPQIDTCAKAVAWTFGFDKVLDYSPLMET